LSAVVESSGDARAAQNGHADPLIALGVRRLDGRRWQWSSIPAGSGHGGFCASCARSTAFNERPPRRRARTTDRDGFVRDEARAPRRGWKKSGARQKNAARNYAEVTGYGRSGYCAYHITSTGHRRLWCLPQHAAAMSAPALALRIDYITTVTSTQIGRDEIRTPASVSGCRLCGFEGVRCPEPSLRDPVIFLLGSSAPSRRSHHFCDDVARQ